MAHNPSSNPTIPTNSSLVADPPNSAASPRPVSTSATTATLGVNQSQSNAQYFDSNHFAYEHYHYPLPVLTEYYQSHNASSRPVGGRASSKTPSPAPISTAHHRLVRDGPTPISTRSIHKISSVPSFSASTPTTNIDTHGDVPNSIKRTLSDSDFKQGNARKAPAIGSYHQRMHSKPLPAAPVTQPGARPQRQEPRSSRPHKSITNIASPTAKSSTPSPPRQQHHGSTIYSSRNLSESTAGSSAASRYASSVSLPHSRASDDKPRTNVTLPATERCSEGISSPVAPLQHR
ncbi:hypothetical protein EV182_007484 [Spiromyces aspiralis]|uniref:Uncharacterized protein n=1 Tax=Spiromyces aspiralis TaxID=68401 RepID=A0ACC1HN75_9FUNG|nr:hypothetical protein EV182_007484 [Spiromyces aspiralis]